MADSRNRHFLKRLPQILRQRSACVKHQPYTGEEPLSQLVVLAQRCNQHVVTTRHVEIDVGNDVAQIGERQCKQSGRRLAAIDVQRAAGQQYAVEIVIAAKRMTPWQPVERGERAFGEKRPALQLRGLIGRQHALGVDDGLGRTGGARREKKFRDGIVIDAGERCCDGSILRRAGNRGKRNRAVVSGRIACDDFCGVMRRNRAQCSRELFCLCDIDRAGLQQRGHGLEFIEILRDQRIGRRDRHYRHADMHRRQHEHRVIDRIVGEDRKRPLRAHVLRKKPAASSANFFQGVAVTQARPWRVGAGALGEKDRIGRLNRPLLQPVADAARVIVERRCGFEPDAAVGFALGVDPRGGEHRIGGFASMRGGLHHSRTHPRFSDEGGTIRPCAVSAKAGIGFPSATALSLRIIVQFVSPLCCG